MTRRLIATMTTPAGRHSAKVYEDPKVNGFTCVFYADGLKVHGADMDVDTEAEARNSAAESLKIADDSLTARAV